jgi:SHS family lactate transporter-like MFS transporter
MFMVGVAPALLVVVIRMWVKESPAFERTRGQPRPNPFGVLLRHWRTALYVIVLMTAFNFFSHGTQDLYPTFLQAQRKLPTHTVSMIAIIANIGAIVGGIVFGMLSERIGRRRAIVFAALLALPIIPLWGFSTSVVLIALGAFLIQISVQGAWGVIPVHLNELSPDDVRGTFPGFAYQLGNLLASANATIQAGFAESRGGNYALALAIVAAAAAVAIALLTSVGPEAHGVEFGVGEAGSETVRVA